VSASHRRNRFGSISDRTVQGPYDRPVAKGRYRLIDTAGSELDIVDLDDDEAVEGSMIELPDGTEGEVVEVYDDEDGREGGVKATLVVDF